jgi:protein-L-isoaspartate(D-aspartate) O-methyltransferase
MSDMLQLTEADKLLEIGTGSASQTVEWASSGCEVHTIELKPVVEPWRLDNEGADQVFAHMGDGKLGLPQEAPFSAIVATCGVEDIPDAWKDQLGPQGRMVVPVGSSSVQRLTLFSKDAEGSFRPIRIAGYVRFSMIH